MRVENGDSDESDDEGVKVRPTYPVYQYPLLRANLPESSFVKHMHVSSDYFCVIPVCMRLKWVGDRSRCIYAPARDPQAHEH